MKKFIAIAVAVGVFCIGLPVMMAIFAVGVATSALQYFNPLCVLSNIVVTPISAAVDVVTGGSVTGPAMEMYQNASIIYQVGKATPGVSNDDIIMALMTSLTETELHNYDHLGAKNDHNSIGLFQQQYGLTDKNGQEYWGTAAQLHDPVYATARFYKELLTKVPDRTSMGKGEAIQKVQVSAFPERYAKNEEKATNWFNQLDKQYNLHPDGQTGGDPIAVVGDSLTVSSNALLFSGLTGAGFKDIRVDAQGGRSVGIDASSTLTDTTSVTSPTLTKDKQPLVSGLSAIKRLRQSGFDPKTWFILLGTNDMLMSGTSEKQITDNVNKMLQGVKDELGSGKQVIWLTVWNTDKPDESKLFNDALKAAAPKMSMGVGDWAALAQQHPEWFADNVHYAQTGSQQRSDFVTQIAKLITSVSGAGGSVFGAIDGIASFVKDCQENSFNPWDAVGGGDASVAVDGPAATEDTPFEQVSNPKLAQAGMGLEQLAGGHIIYGASTSKWAATGVKGNFGHGNKDQWLAQAQTDPKYRSLDCSGFINAAVYFAYKINFNGCSYDYKNLVINGQTMTKPVMQGHIDPAKLQSGDFIIRINKPCGSGDEINHIIMVVSVSGTEVTTIESHAGTSTNGVEVRKRDAQKFFNTDPDWRDLVVSRWVGPGSISVQPGGVATSTTTTGVPASP